MFSYRQKISTKIFLQKKPSCSIALQKGFLLLSDILLIVANDTHCKVVEHHV